MASRKHDLLDISSNEDESDRGYDSEDNVAESKGRAVKRRRTADNQDPFGFESEEEDSDINSDEDDEPRAKGKGRKQTKTQDAEKEDEEDDDEEDGGASLNDTEEASKSKGKLLNKKLAKLASGKPPKKDKSGVVYLSSLPPYLKPVSSILKALNLPY